MAEVSIRLPDDQHERLKSMAAARGISLNKLIEEFSTKALAEFDAETRFRMRAIQGDRKLGLKLLDRLDEHYGTQN